MPCHVIHVSTLVVLGMLCLFLMITSYTRSRHTPGSIKHVIIHCDISYCNVYLTSHNHSHYKMAIRGNNDQCTTGKVDITHNRNVRV